VAPRAGGVLAHMHYARITLVCSLLLSFAAAGLAQQIAAPTTQLLRLSSNTVGRSNIFHLRAGDAIIVTGSSNDPQFAVDLYVYDSHQALVGKDDEDSVSAAFQWQCPLDGDYYVFARNLSSGAGSILISISSAMSPPSNAVPAAFAQVRIFYATDRNQSGQSEPNLFYGTQPDAKGDLRLGEAIVSVPRAHEMGELEGPSILRLEFREDPTKHVVLQSVTEEVSGTFVTDLARRVSHSQKKEALVFIHGFNTTFSDAARRTAQIAYDLGFDGPAILYSWPSQGEPTPFAYNKDARNAELTVDHLRGFLDLLVAQSGATTIHVIAHSMGNRPMTAALVQEAANAKTSPHPIFDQIVLMAPDIDAARFKQMAQSFRTSARRFTLYASSRDEALRLSQAYAGYPRAGEGGPNIVVVPGVDTIDASVVDTSLIGFYHQYYADNSTVLADVFHVLQGDAAGARFGLQAVTTSLGPYWKFRPAAR
jgi:esterase/lipase superfamily enzyme